MDHGQGDHLNDRSSRWDDEQIDAAWEEIAQDLADIDVPDDPLEDFTDGEEPSVVAQTRMHGPRDWEAAEEDEEHFEGFEDATGTLTLMPVGDPQPSGHAWTPFAWIAAVGLIVYAFLAAFSVLPGGGVIALAAGACGFSLAAFAAFMASPAEEEIDPFDDGARL